MQMAWENFPALYGALRQTQGQATATQRASAVVEMPIVHSGADHPPQASRTQGHDQPVYFPSGPLQRVPGAAAAAVAPTSTGVVAVATTTTTTTTRTGPRPTTLALSPNSQEVKRKERVRKRESRAKRKREEVAVAQAQAAEKAARNAAKQKKFRHKKKK